MSDLSALPEFLKPRLRLFFGADLVGSTSFKQKGEYPLADPNTQSFDSMGATWFSPIAEFYRRIEQEFFTAWSECKRRYQHATGDTLLVSPVLWKANGDELIFSADLIEPDDAAYVLAAWLHALQQYRTLLRGSKVTRSLDVKGSAWLAGFPIGNAEVIFCSELKSEVNRFQAEDPKIFHFSMLELWYGNADSRAGLIKDYVGPSIDTGFRISAQANPRKFTVSLELALILSDIHFDKEFWPAFGLKANHLPLGFDGLQTFKGVLGGKPYPLFWIDALSGDELWTAYDKVDGEKIVKDRTALKDFCQKYIQENANHLFHPFIANCRHAHYRKMPDNYAATIERLAERWQQEKERLNVRWASMLQPDANVPEVAEEVIDAAMVKELLIESSKVEKDLVTPVGSA